MKHGLPAIRAVIRDQPVACFIDLLFFCEPTRHGEEMTHQRFVRFFESGYRLDVTVRHDQDMRRRDRVDIAKGGRLFVAIRDGAGDVSLNDLAEDAVVVGHVELSVCWGGVSTPLLLCDCSKFYPSL